MPEPTSPESNQRPLRSERLLMDAAVEQKGWGGTRGLVISPGRAQTARLMAEQLHYQIVHAWYLDLHDATTTSNFFSSWNEEASAQGKTAVEVLSGADLPNWNGGPGDGEEGTSTYDCIALITLKRSESELTRDLLQQAHTLLEPGGYLVASVDHAKDNWLHDQLRAMFEKVTCQRGSEGSVYWARKSKPLKKLRDFSCEFDFKDEDHILLATTRPGVFSHRRLDPGAKQLMLCCEIDETDHVLDMGCGCGALTMAAAKRTKGKVYGIDSNARAIECLNIGLQRNGIENVTAIWNADGQLELPEPIDVALANPPYYGDDSISQLFVETARASLRVGGALLVVSKQPGWYEAYFDTCMEDIVTFEAGHYFVTCGRKT